MPVGLRHCYTPPLSSVPTYMNCRTLYFFGLGNLELKMVAMCYEMSFGSTQPEPVSYGRIYGRQTARANIDNTQHVSSAGPSDTTHWIQNNSGKPPPPPPPPPRAVHPRVKWRKRRSKSLRLAPGSPRLQVQTTRSSKLQ